MNKLTLSGRFLSAYNLIDNTLRTIYKIKRGLSFADGIRRTASYNAVIAKYEEKLIDYGRLRNAIVHYGTDEKVIAEPHMEVVLEMEKIARLLSTPPKAVEIAVLGASIVTLKHNLSLNELLKQFYLTGFASIPILKEGKIIGVINHQILNLEIGKKVSLGCNISEFLEETKIEDILTVDNQKPHFIICDENLTLEEVYRLCQFNRKLTTILITKTGKPTEKLIGLITYADIFKINDILDNY